MRPMVSMATATLPLLTLLAMERRLLRAPETAKIISRDWSWRLTTTGQMIWVSNFAVHFWRDARICVSELICRLKVSSLSRHGFSSLFHSSKPIFHRAPREKKVKILILINRLCKPTSSQAFLMTLCHSSPRINSNHNCAKMLLYLRKTQSKRR